MRVRIVVATLFYSVLLIRLVSRASWSHDKPVFKASAAFVREFILLNLSCIKVVERWSLILGSWVYSCPLLLDNLKKRVIYIDCSRSSDWPDLAERPLSSVPYMILWPFVGMKWRDCLKCHQAVEFSFVWTATSTTSAFYVCTVGIDIWDCWLIQN